MNVSNVSLAVRTVSLVGALVSISLWCGCNRGPTPERSTPAAASASLAPAPLVSALLAPPRDEQRAAAVPASVAPMVPSSARGAEPPLKSDRLALGVKRFVVGSGVKDREPLVSEAPLRSDGSPIYAFVELSNLQGDSENVRVTFERRGGKERVGDVSLPIPGKVTRHRTWAFTRFIRAPGVWDAVLWSDQGVELSRASFEVIAG